MAAVAAGQGRDGRDRDLMSENELLGRVSTQEPVGPVLSCDDLRGCGDLGEGTPFHMPVKDILLFVTGRGRLAAATESGGDGPSAHER